MDLFDFEKFKKDNNLTPHDVAHLMTDKEFKEIISYTNNKLREFPVNNFSLGFKTVESGLLNLIILKRDGKNAANVYDGDLNPWLFHFLNANEAVKNKNNISVEYREVVNKFYCEQIIQTIHRPDIALSIVSKQLDYEERVLGDSKINFLKRTFSNKYAEIIESKICNLSQEGVRIFANLDKLKKQNNDIEYLNALGEAKHIEAKLKTSIDAMAHNMIIGNSMETSFNKVNDALLSLSQVSDTLNINKENAFNHHLYFNAALYNNSEGIININRLKALNNFKNSFSNLVIKKNLNQNEQKELLDSVFDKFKNPNSSLLIDLRLQVEENEKVNRSKMRLK